MWRVVCPLCYNCLFWDCSVPAFLIFFFIYQKGFVYFSFFSEWCTLKLLYLACFYEIKEPWLSLICSTEDPQVWFSLPLFSSNISFWFSSSFTHLNVSSLCVKFWSYYDFFSYILRVTNVNINYKYKYKFYIYTNYKYKFFHAYFVSSNLLINFNNLIHWILKAQRHTCTDNDNVVQSSSV